MDSAQLLALVGALRGRSVAVVGDVVADEFVYGRVARVSREAPVLILEYDSTEIVPGGAGNAANNVASLGGTATLAAVVGRDEPGQRLLRALHKRVDQRRVVRAAGRPTPVKTRILAGGVHSTKQQVVRIDKATRLAEQGRVRRRVREALRDHRGRVDGVLVSDYGFGLIDPELVGAAVAFARKRRVPVTVDSRFALLGFRGMTAVTPNEPEVEAALGITIGHDVKRLEAAGRTLLRRLGVRAALVTRGSDGMALFEPRRKPQHIPIYGSDQVADVTGAGDTVIAAFTLALTAGATPTEAAHLANYAGGIVVMKRGTATVSAAELRRAVSQDQSIA